MDGTDGIRLCLTLQRIFATGDPAINLGSNGSKVGETWARGDFLAQKKPPGARKSKTGGRDGLVAERKNEGVGSSHTAQKYIVNSLFANHLETAGTVADLEAELG